MANAILCRLATCRIVAEMIAAGAEPLARALENSLSTSPVRPAQAASTTLSSAISDATATGAAPSAGAAKTGGADSIECNSPRTATRRSDIGELDARLTARVKRQFADFVAR